jgi:hypothetical protein
MQLALFALLTGVLIAAYLAPTVPSGLAPVTRWVLPSLGVGLAVAFGVLATNQWLYGRALLERGRQIEAAVHVLVPGLAHVRTLGLLTHLALRAADAQPTALAVSAASYTVCGVGWLGAMLAMLLGWRS